MAPLVYATERYRLRKNKAISERRRQLSALRLAFGVLSCTMMAVMTIEMGKGYVGALRPSFARRCFNPREPPYIPSLASGDDVIKGVYISDADCPTMKREELRDGRRSFPSGHAALAVSGVAYGQLALIRFARSADIDDVLAVGVAIVSWMWFLFAAWVSASRVFDSAHHVQDVAVGCIVGFWCAVVHFWFVVGRNHRAEARDANSETKNSGLVLKRE